MRSSSPIRVSSLDELECLRVLGRHTVGRLGFSAGALPVVLPVSFVLRDQTLYFRTDAGLKLDAAKTAAVACLEVDDYDGMHHTGASVLATGRLELVTDSGGRDDLSSLPLQPWGASTAQHLVQLPIELLSGREASQQLPA